MEIRETEKLKMVRSEGYNYLFRKDNGVFMRWGKTKEEDPNFSPFGSEILDLEATTVCPGVPGLPDSNGNMVESPCRFCYKSNTKNGKNMTLDTFKAILDKFPKYNGIHFLTQVAFGADSNATSNPELFDMMAWARKCGVIPNITVANISDETADKLVSVCGAVAVSRYANKNICYDSVKRLTDRGLSQTNIHQMVSLESFDQAMETLHDRLTDPRLAKMNAIVLLSLKQKGRGVSFNRLPDEKYKQLIDFALENKIPVGLKQILVFENIYR